MTVEQFLADINRTFTGPQDDQKFQTLTRLLCVDPTENRYVTSIYNNTAASSHVSSSIHTEYDADWPAFGSVVSSFIRLCQLCDPWSALRSFDLYTTYLNDLSIAFNNNNFGWLLSGVIKSTIGMVLPWALRLDRSMFQREQGGRYRLGFMASVLLKIFNNIRVNDTNKYKKSIMLYLGNKLCYIYWKLDNPLLCRNIFSNMNNTSLKIDDFPRGEQLKYRFYLAKYYFIKYELIECFRHLSWCLVNTSSAKNQKLVIELLLPVSLVLGKKPNFGSLQQQVHDASVHEALHIYSELFRVVARGDHQSFTLLLERNHHYLKRNNALLLMNRVEILLYRNLVRHVWRILGQPLSVAIDVVPTLESDSLFKENLFVSLIDSNMIKGKLTTKGVLVLSKTDTFPDVFDIYTKRFGTRNGQANDWM
ncbi:uncharacterized protein LODBEIA_P05490 [Lodderomyces beijingensis]|uniref:PCI domain-containing protein n=1 Tax=Lodderomyces beijingensis TaxID=1775926 RepID=A0ABP0ZDS0_9ASCO